MEFKNCVEQVYMYLELKDPTGNSDVTINSYVSNHTPCEEVGFELEVRRLCALDGTASEAQRARTGSSGRYSIFYSRS